MPTWRCPRGEDHFDVERRTEPKVIARSPVVLAQYLQSVEDRTGKYPRDANQLSKGIIRD
jgi:hypothetical protein